MHKTDLRDMYIESNKNGNYANIKIQGYMYTENVIKVRDITEDFFEQGVNSFIFDLSDLHYIDSTGLGLLVTLKKKCDKRGGGITIKGVQGIVKDLFVLTRMDNVFDLVA